VLALAGPPYNESMRSQLHDSLGVEYVARCSFNDLRFEELTYASGFECPSHVHEKEVFLDLTLKGNVQEFWGKDTLLRGPSALAFIPAGAPHGNVYREDGRALQIGMKGHWLDRIRQLKPLSEASILYENGLPTWIASRLYAEFRQQDDVSPLVLEGLLLELLGEISRSAPHSEEGSCPRWLARAKDYLHAHFTETLNVQAIANAVGVHPSHLMRAFRQRFRCTIGEYVRKLRIDYACHLLTDSNPYPAEVAHLVGFTDQSHFNRTFKKYMGMTPTEFRNAARHATHRPQMLAPFKLSTPLAMHPSEQ
jgi:AraC family transcriptional regulator